MADGKNDSTPFIKNGASPIIAKTPLPAKSVKPGKEGRGKAFRQIIASFIANLGTINTGMAFGFSATALPQLKSATSSIQITENQASWIASLSSAGTPIGCIISGYLMDNIGRRRTLIVTEVPLILGWLLISCAQNVPMIYVGRLLIGFGSGMVGAPARVYTCEVSQPHLRGMLGAMASVGVSTGVLIQYVIGSVTSWNILAGVSAIVPILSLLGMIFLPETPNYLLTQDKEEKAKNSLAKLRGSTCNLQDEIQKMISFKEKNHVEPLKTPKEIIKALMSPSALKPFGILALYFFIYQWCGVNTITFYAVEVFEASGATLDKYYLTISMGVLRVIFTVVGCILCRRCGRRPLTFVSALGCGSTMITLSVYLYYVQYWKDNSMEPQNSWIPVASIYLFTIFCTLGYLIVPWIMIGEVFPTQVRGIIGGMTTCAAHLSIFSVVKTFPYLKHSLNDYGAFGLYGCMSIAGMAFFYVFLPETKGRTLQEIEDYFSGRTKVLKKPSITETALKTPKEIIKALMSPSALKPFGILALYFFIYQWCGVNTITFYAVEVFEASGATLDKYYLTISMGVLRVIFTVVGCILCRRCGRRPLTFVSALGCGSTMITLSVYLYYVQYWKDNSMEPQNSWIPVASIYLFTIFCTLGYLIVPWIMIGEVYPTQVRGIIGGMTTCAAHLSIFSVVKTFPYLKHSLNDYGAFGLYGCMSIAGMAFFYVFLPETKGRTLQEIEDYFSGRTKVLKKPSITETALSSDRERTVNGIIVRIWPKGLY